MELLILSLCLIEICLYIYLAYAHLGRSVWEKLGQNDQIWQFYFTKKTYISHKMRS